HLARGIHNSAGYGQLGSATANQRAVVAIRDETDFHAIGFIRQPQTGFPSDGPDLLLAIATHRKEQAWQEVARQAEEHVGLILLPIDRPLQVELAGTSDDLGIVAGRNEIGLELLAVPPELAELQPAITDHTGVRRPPGQVLVREVIDDAIEIFLEVQGVEGD